MPNVTLNDEVFRLYREFKKKPPFPRRISRKIDRIKDRLDRQTDKSKIRLLWALRQLRSYPNLYIDINGL